MKENNLFQPRRVEEREEAQEKEWTKMEEIFSTFKNKLKISIAHQNTFQKNIFKGKTIYSLIKFCPDIELTSKELFTKEELKSFLIWKDWLGIRTENGEHYWLDIGNISFFNFYISEEQIVSGLEDENVSAIFARATADQYIIQNIGDI